MTSARRLVPVASVEAPATLDAGFAFCRMQRDPAFREHLREIGWRSGVHIVMMLPGDSISAVAERVAANGIVGRFLVAFEDELARFGFRLMLATFPDAR